MIDTFIVVIPLMLSPGPANLVSFALGTRYGFVQLLPFQMGILLVYGIVGIGLGLLTKQIVAFSPNAVRTLQIAGGSFIVFLGLKLVCRSKRDAPARSPTMLNGILLQCLNPKFPGVVLAVFANRHTQPVLVNAFVICIVGATGLLSYSTAGSLLRARHQPDRQFKAVDVVAGVLMCGVGLWFIFLALFNS